MMITFDTANSTYQVRVENGQFAITKIAASNPDSTYNAVGQTRYSRGINIIVGDRAYFDGWSTSPVTQLVEHREMEKTA